MTDRALLVLAGLFVFAYLLEVVGRREGRIIERRR